MSASSTRRFSYAYASVREGDESSPDCRRLAGEPSTGGRPCALSTLMLANAILALALTAALIYTLLLMASLPTDPTAKAVDTATTATADDSPTTAPLPSLPPSGMVDRTLVSLGLPVSGSARLSARTSVLTVMLMNRTGTHFEQPAKQGTFVNTNLEGVSPAAFHSALLAYYHSVCQQRLNAIVLHDIDPSRAAHYFSIYERRPYSFLGQSYLCNVTFVYAVHLVSAELYSSLHPYDLRWLLYERYLASRGGWYDWLLFSDVSDVTFERNPFDFMLRQWVEDERHPTIFVGRDPLPIRQHDFCIQRFAACQLSYRSFADRMAVSAGVLGGWVTHCQWLLAALTRYFEQLALDQSASSRQCRHLGADMAVFNSLFLDPSGDDQPLRATPRPLPFNWYAEDSGLVGGAFTGPFAFQRSVPGRQFIRHKTAWEGQQPQEWEHHLRSGNNTKTNCPLLAD